MNEQTHISQGPLASAIDIPLSHHRALGKRFDSEEAALRLLDRYLLEQAVEIIPAITPLLLQAFVRSRPRTRPRSYNHLVNVLQRFFAGWSVRRYSPLRPAICTHAVAPPSLPLFV